VETRRANDYSKDIRAGVGWGLKLKNMMPKQSPQSFLIVIAEKFSHIAMVYDHEIKFSVIPFSISVLPRSKKA